MQEKDSSYSVSMKQYITRGWNHPYHQERVLKYRERYFKDVQLLSSKLKGDHFQSFYERLAPFEDNLEWQIAKFEEMSFPAGM